MGVETEWYGDDGRIVQVILKSPWAWIELERAFDRGLALISPVEHVVYFLIDFEDQSRPPRGNSIMHLKRVIERSSAAPNFGKSILVNPNPFARSIIGMLLRFYGNSARISPGEQPGGSARNHPAHGPGRGRSWPDDRGLGDFAGPQLSPKFAGRPDQRTIRRCQRSADVGDGIDCAREAWDATDRPVC